MARIFYIHWNKPEALERVRELRDWGHSVAYEAVNGAACCDKIKTIGYDAVVISLTRLPSHGRTVAEHLASMKATRDIPIVFVDGEPEKLAKVRAAVPRATFISSAQLRTQLESTTSTRTPTAGEVAQRPRPK